MHRNARSVPLPSFRLSVSPSALIYFSPPQPDSFPFASVHEASRKGETKHEVRFLEHSSLSLSLSIIPATQSSRLLTLDLWTAREHASESHIAALTSVISLQLFSLPFLAPFSCFNKDSSVLAGSLYPRIYAVMSDNALSLNRCIAYTQTLFVTNNNNNMISSSPHCSRHFLSTVSSTLRFLVFDSL